jgi:hypothetical protein|tara:strand:+ start:1057 stop:1374 length:318 start_codon:yes stop_codon:yes gene_type:complete
MKFPRKHFMKKHPKRWLDALGRVWLFQKDFTPSEAIRQWIESDEWDESIQLVFILWGELEDIAPPLPIDGTIELVRRSTGETRQVSISQIYDESGFKLAALVELV